MHNFFNQNWSSFKTRLREIEIQLEAQSYNIISLSSYSGHLENYHSDIWGFLLDKNAGHKKQNLFLSLFIDFLINNKILAPEYENDLKQAEVFREKGRIDVLIVNRQKQICIILENKINNAVDQIDQLERYIETAKKNHWRVASTLYVSLNGNLLSSVNGGHYIHPLAAVNADKPCLLDGWLIPAKNSIPFDGQPANEDARSFIHQYNLLLKKLSAKTLLSMGNEILYNLVNSKENFETALLIETQLENLKLYREQLFTQALETHFKKLDYFKPAFTKKGIYANTPNYLIFSNFKFEGMPFQLDIAHFKNRTNFVFYNSSNKLSALETSTLLTSIIGDHNFISTNPDLPHHLAYTIQFENNFASLNELDKQVQEFGIKLFSDFNKFVEKRAE